MNSSRLPGKHMLLIKKKPVIWYLVERLKLVKKINTIVLATTINKIDDVLVDFAKKSKINFYRGSELDVVGRVYKAAKKFNAKNIIDVSGDCPLIDPELIDQSIKTFEINNLDFLSTAAFWSYPGGTDVNIYNFKTIKEVNKRVIIKKEREHTCPYIVQNNKKFKTVHLVAPQSLSCNNIVLTLDEKKDFILIKNIIIYFAKKKKLFFSIKDIVDLYKKKRSLFNINTHVKRNNTKIQKI